MEKNFPAPGEISDNNRFAISLNSARVTRDAVTSTLANGNPACHGSHDDGAKALGLIVSGRILTRTHPIRMYRGTKKTGDGGLEPGAKGWGSRADGDGDSWLAESRRRRRRTNDDNDETTAAPLSRQQTDETARGRER